MLCKIPKQVSLFAAFILVAIVFALLFGYHRAKVEAIAQVEKTLILSAKEQAALLQVNIAGQYEVLDTFVAALVADKISDIPTVQKRANVMKDASRFVSVSYVTPDGKSHVIDGKTADIASREYFKRTMHGQRTMEKVHGDRVYGWDVFVLTSPIVREGVVSGFIMGGYTEESFRNLLVPKAYERQSHYFITKTNGEFLITCEHLITEEKNCPTLFDLLQKDKINSAAFSKLTADIKNSNSGAMEFFWHGNKQFLVYYPTQVDGTYIFIMVDMALVEEEAMASTYILMKILLILGGLACIAVAVIIARETRNLRRIEKEKERLAISEKKNSEQNKTILASIRYASKIQRNLIPQGSMLRESFEDSFAIWKPRDIVGGDIYWLKKFSEGSTLCVCDCTGHGTPGALLTMLASSAFENLINERNCMKPAQLVYEIDRRFATVLNTSEQQSCAELTQITNGCDLAVLFVAKNGTVTFSSANIPVFVCNGHEVRQIKGQHLSIGSGQLKDSSAIKTIVIPPSANNKFYIASDGLYDQIGGESDIPFGYARFKTLVLENHTQPQAFIAKKIWTAFERYRGRHDRRDDVELITFKP